MAAYRGRLYVGGDGPEVYAYDFATQTWQQYMSLSGWTAVTQLVTFSDKLLVFGTGGGSLFKAFEVNTAQVTGQYILALGFEVVDWTLIA